MRATMSDALKASDYTALFLTGSEMNSPIFSIGVTSALLSSDQGPIGKCRASCSVKAHSSSNSQIASSLFPDLDGLRYCTLIDVKIFDPAAPPIPTRQLNPPNTAIEL